MKRSIYLDYAATTPVDPRVAECMCRFLTPEGEFGNPASRSHLYGWRAEEAVELARRQIADLIGADPREIVWTSGATEANNLAIKGLAQARADRGRHIVTSSIEHKAVLDPCAWLERQGWEVTRVDPDADGLAQPQRVASALRDDTVLVSIMHANNELGTVNDIAAIGALCRERGVVFHVDAAQSVGKLPVDLKTTPVDLLSLSAHKFYGPKGVGALYVRRHPELRLEAQIHGGGHERGLRSGTLPTHQIAGLGAAAALCAELLPEEGARLRGLRELLWEGVRELPGVGLNGHPERRLPGHLSLHFAGLDGESLLVALKDLAVSSGSACTSASLEPSYVLRAMGLSDALAHASLRFTVGRFTAEEDVAQAVACIRHAVTRLQGLS